MDQTLSLNAKNLGTLDRHTFILMWIGTMNFKFIGSASSFCLLIGCLDFFFVAEY